MEGRPSNSATDGRYFLLVFENVGTLSGSGRIWHDIVFAVLDNLEGPVLLFVTLERSIAGRGFACVFEADGRHLNLGRIDDADIRAKFAQIALQQIRERFPLGRLERINVISDGRQSA